MSNMGAQIIGVVIGMFFLSIGFGLIETQAQSNITACKAETPVNTTCVQLWTFIPIFILLLVIAGVAAGGFVYGKKKGVF